MDRRLPGDEADLFDNEPDVSLPRDLHRHGSGGGPANLTVNFQINTRAWRSLNHAASIFSRWPIASAAGADKFVKRGAHGLQVADARLDIR